MATKTFDELKQMAIQIRDEKTNKQNTANRIGTEMLEHLDKLEQDYYDKTTTDEELKKRDDKLTELSRKISGEEQPLDTSIKTEDTFVSSNGGLSEASGFCITNPIQVNKGDAIVALTSGYLVNVAVISYTDEQGSTYEPIIKSDENYSQLSCYYAIIEKNGYVAFSYRKSYNLKAYRIRKSGIIGLLAREIIKGNQVDEDITNAIYKRIPLYTDNILNVVDETGLTVKSGSLNCTVIGSACTLVNNDKFRVVTVDVLKGQVIVYRGDSYSKNVAIFAETDSGNTFYKSLLISNNKDNEQKYVDVYFIATKNMKIAVTAYENGVISIGQARDKGLLSQLRDNVLLESIKTNSDKVPDIEKNIGIEDYTYTTPSYTLTEGYFVVASGVFSENADYAYTSPIKVYKGDIYVLEGGAYLTNVAVFSECDEDGNNINMVVRSANISSQSTKKKKYYYIASKDTYIIASAVKGFTFNKIQVAAGLMQQIANIVSKIDDAKNQVRYIDMFNKVLFIGDSVTEGHVVDREVGVSKMMNSMNYPTRLNQLVPHLEIINKGHGGESVQGWNKNRFETEYVANKEGVDLVIMELGWNQQGDYSWPSNTESFENEFQNNVKAFGENFADYITENSAVGNYCQLVKKILNASPNIVLILVASFGFPVVRANFIKEIAKWAGVLFVDAHSYQSDAGSGDVHFTPFGYTYKANIMLNLINEALLDNKDYVKMQIYKNNDMLPQSSAIAP